MSTVRLMALRLIGGRQPACVWGARLAKGTTRGATGRLMRGTSPMPVTLRRVASAKRQKAQAKKNRRHVQRRRTFQAGRPQPARPTRLRDPRDVRVRYRPSRGRSQVAAPRSGDDRRCLRPGRARRGMASLHAHPPIPRTPPDSVPLTLTDDGSFSSIDPRSTSCSHAPNNKRCPSFPCPSISRTAGPRWSSHLLGAVGSTTRGRSSQLVTPTGMRSVRHRAPPGRASAGDLGATSSRRMSGPPGDTGENGLDRGANIGHTDNSKGAIGFDFGRQLGRSEPWFPEPR